MFYEIFSSVTTNILVIVYNEEDAVEVHMLHIENRAVTVFYSAFKICISSSAFIWLNLKKINVSRKNT